MAEGDIGAVIATLEFDTTIGKLPCIIHISGDVFVIAYRGQDDDGWLCTVTIDKDGNIGPIIDRFEFDPVAGNYVDIIHVSGNIYAVAYAGGAGLTGRVCTVTIEDDGQIGATVIDTLNFEPVAIQEPTIVHVAGNVYAISYHITADADGWLCTINIDATGNIGATTIDTFEFDNVAGQQPTIVHVAGNVYAIAYRDSLGHGNLRTVTVDNAGNIGAAVIDTLQFDAVFCSEPNIIHISGDVFAITYRGGVPLPHDDGELCTVSIDSAGNIGPATIDTFEFKVDYGYSPRIIWVSGEVYAIVHYRSPASSGYVSTITIHNDGFIVHALIDQLIFVAAGTYPDIIRVLSNTYAIAYELGVTFHGVLRTVNIETHRDPIAQTDPATLITYYSASLNGALVDDGGPACACGFEWGDTPAYGNTTPTQNKTTGQTFSQPIIGLDPNKIYHFIAFATNPAGTGYGSDRSFTTLKTTPTATTDPATGIVDNSASINGTLSNDGGEACACGFEWGLTPAYGNTTPTQSRTTGQTFAQTVDPLNPSTTYYFRAIATNSLGTSYGAQRSFTTLQVPYYASRILPNVQTNPATLITEHAARLNGIIIEDGGNSGDTRFQWGLTTSYGNITPWQQGFAKGDTFFVDLNNLAEGTAFHFRAQFRVQGKMIDGNDMTFNTLTTLGPVTLIDDELIYLLEAV